MRTTHLTSLTTSFSPFTTVSKVPRLFLALLPPNAHKSIKIKQTLLPRPSPSTASPPASLELAFKDGKVLKYKWEDAPRAVVETHAKDEKKVKLQDVVEEVERHTRQLARKEELAG